MFCESKNLFWEEIYYFTCEFKMINLVEANLDAKDL